MPLLAGAARPREGMPCGVSVMGAAPGTVHTKARRRSRCGQRRKKSAITVTDPARRDIPRDILRDFLCEEYQAGDPVWNFLRYKFGAHTLTADGAKFGHVDQYILREELKAVRAEGFDASADTIFSLWNTLTQAIALESGDEYYTNSAKIAGTWYKTPASCAVLGGRWGGTAKSRSSLGVRLLLDAHEEGRYRGVTRSFHRVARLIHRPGNMLLVPVIGLDRAPKVQNLNLARNARDRDYFDRTLNRIQGGQYSQFFPDSGAPDPQVAARFRIASEGGVPTSEGFAAFVAAHRLGMFLNADGSVRELWEGSLTRAGLPRTAEHCRAWIARAESIICERDAAVAGVAGGEF